MIDRTLDENGFVDLWPTRFLQRNIPNAEAANQALLQLILDQEKQHLKQQSKDASSKDMTTDYLSNNLFEIDNPVIDWLKTCVNKTVSDYFNEQSLDYRVDWGCKAGRTLIAKVIIIIYTITRIAI